jgi:hypothetical protein
VRQREAERDREKQRETERSREREGMRQNEKTHNKHTNRKKSDWSTNPVGVCVLGSTGTGWSHDSTQQRKADSHWSRDSPLRPLHRQQAKTEGGAESETETETETERETETETETERDRETERYRQRQRQRQREASTRYLRRHGKGAGALEEVTFLQLSTVTQKQQIH